MKVYGLIGKTLRHSFSPGFFNKKFCIEKIDAEYRAFELADIELSRYLLHDKNIAGLNITIPYKESIIPFLDHLDDTAEMIGAVNCIQMHKGQLKGYNTDIVGFTRSLRPLLRPQHDSALILGTGGASKAVQAGLRLLQIPYSIVSRDPAAGELGYEQLDETMVRKYKVIVNTTPLGMYPNNDTLPSIPYGGITQQHLLYDLVYNPGLTAFLASGQDKGAIIKNGQEMLELQALAAWDIWNEGSK